ncbi:MULTISPECIES: delta-lactam-biosynthetic de-N-acetylase [Pontibacillus]|uniref:Delta-lactam-biosynthetic de-N-acetylase n=1 Tax=Pontibacillus chungwhensis TaxID=265426 RepID=A0ABY8V2E2_9BACI|nr:MULTISPECIES: delta-lactam-biosynthetic de-N-acetylase [Pontibacillus]MCD5325483.1 delta-lactam-biosynthetic de-N-acetylase [Pontibacillus sp. HN14]WIG00117.1 delta-lactam-biosynthetic de-N-acetylase [Pontibacillus chungwhensis]
MVVMSLLYAPDVSAHGSYGWGFSRGGEGEAPDVGKYGPLLEKYGGYYMDKTDEKVVYLTFDNGYEQGYTDEILDVLKDKEVPATFFVTGHYVNSASDLVKRMVKEGHIVGNHSWSHPDFSKTSPEKIKKELKRVEDAVAKITDQDSMQYLRPPRGTFSENSLAATQELGYITMFWSLAFVDWHTDGQKGWEYAYRSVMQQVHPGAIILLHTVSEDNALALEHMIDELHKRGYTFKSLDDLVLKQMLPDPLQTLSGL